MITLQEKTLDELKQICVFDENGDDTEIIFRYLKKRYSPNHFAMIEKIIKQKIAESENTPGQAQKNE